MKIKTSEATGLQLDWGLAVAVGADHIWHYEGEVCAQFHLVEYEPYSHTDPAVCMANIAREYGKVWKVEAIPRTTSPTALAMGFSVVGADVTKAYGKTLAEAVARCVISMRLGDEFECPSELWVIE